MAQLNLNPINGIVQDIRALEDDCCMHMMTLETDSGVVNFTIEFDTYVINEVKLTEGMPVTAFYDATMPVPLIYPPQYQAIIIGQRNPEESIIVTSLSPDMTATDNSIKINIGPDTEIVATNGQPYTCGLIDRFIIVYYSVTTRSIPPQTTPRKIIVPC